MLKETNRFAQLNADPCSYAGLVRLDADSDFGEVCFVRVRVKVVSVSVRLRLRLRLRVIS